MRERIETGCLGFTGTEKGATQEQVMRLVHALHDLAPEAVRIGECRGADDQCAYLCAALGIMVIGHPPVNQSKLGLFQYRVQVEPQPYLVRNKAIVDGCGLLIACPRGEEELRSGTWSTIRYAKKQRKPIWIIERDGLLVVIDKS